MNFDRIVAAASIAVYVASVLALLPPSGYLRMLGGGAVVFAAVMAIAHVRRNRAVSGWSVFAISIAAAAVLVVPGFPAMGGRDSPAVPVGLFGSQAAAVLWVTLRWSPEEPAKHRTSLKGALVYSVLGGMCLGLIATIPIVIAIITDRGIARSLLLVYPSYFFGTAAVAVTYWLLQTITHRPVGRYLLGVLGGFCMYASVGPVVDIVEGDPIDIRELLVSAAVCGLLVGPPVAMSLSNSSGSSRP